MVHFVGAEHVILQLNLPEKKLERLDVIYK